MQPSQCIQSQVRRPALRGRMPREATSSRSQRKGAGHRFMAKEFESLRARHFGKSTIFPTGKLRYHACLSPATRPTFARAFATVRSGLPPECPTRGAASRPFSLCGGDSWSEYRTRSGASRAGGQDRLGYRHPPPCGNDCIDRIRRFDRPALAVIILDDQRKEIEAVGLPTRLVGSQPRLPRSSSITQMSVW